MSQRDLCPEGFHGAEILEHGWGAAKTGTPQFITDFLVMPDPAKPEETWQVRGFFAMSDAAAEYTIQKIRNMGYAGDKLEELNGEPPILQGHQVVIQVKHSVYEGKTTAKVEWVYPEGWTPGMKKDENAAANVTRFNALLKKVKPASEKEESLEDALGF